MAAISNISEASSAERRYLRWFLFLLLAPTIVLVLVALLLLSLRRAPQAS